MILKNFKIIFLIITQIYLIKVKSSIIKNELDNTVSELFLNELKMGCDSAINSISPKTPPSGWESLITHNSNSPKPFSSSDVKNINKNQVQNIINTWEKTSSWPNQATLAFTDIINTQSEEFKVFTVTTKPTSETVCFTIGAARAPPNENIVMGYINSCASGITIQQYQTIHHRCCHCAIGNCGTFFHWCTWGSKCDEQVPRSFTSSELNIIRETLNTYALPDISNQANNLAKILNLPLPYPKEKIYKSLK